MTTAPGTRPGAGWLLALAALALLVRLAFVAVMPPAILWPDGREYAAVAHGLLHGEGFGPQTLRPPGYPAFIAAVWAVTGERLLPLRLLEALLGTLTTLAIGVFGTRWFGRAAGLAAMALAALHPVLAFLPATGYSENLVVAVMVLAYGALLGAIADPRAGGARWIAAGMLFGVAALVRPNTVLLLPGLLIGAAWVLGRAGRPWRMRTLGCLLAVVVTVTPWMVRNHRVHGQWFFIATGGGRSLWLGNNARTTGRGGSIMLPDSALATELDALPDDIARDRRLADEAGRYVHEHPGRAAGLYVTRLGSLWALYPETYTRNRFTGNSGRIAMGIMTLIVYFGAFLGWGVLRDSPLRLPMAISILTGSLASAAFFMVMRYRMPFEPFLLWMAGAGWAARFVRAPRSS